MKQLDQAQPASAAQVAQEDAYYLEYLNDLTKHLEHVDGETVTPETDPFLNALANFADAAGRLQAIWLGVGSDGDHPVLTCGKYPFDKSFEDVMREVIEWRDAARERAASAFARANAVYQVRPHKPESGVDAFEVVDTRSVIGLGPIVIAVVGEYEDGELQPHTTPEVNARLLLEAHAIAHALNQAHPQGLPQDLTPKATITPSRFGEVQQ